jgi:hypothetical protein
MRGGARWEWLILVGIGLLACSGLIGLASVRVHGKVMAWGKIVLGPGGIEPFVVTLFVYSCCPAQFF